MLYYILAKLKWKIKARGNTYDKNKWSRTSNWPRYVEKINQSEAKGFQLENAEKLKTH